MQPLPSNSNGKRKLQDTTAVLDRLNINGSVCDLLPSYFPLKKRLRYLEELRLGKTPSVVRLGGGGGTKDSPPGGTLTPASNGNATGAQ